MFDDENAMCFSFVIIVATCEAPPLLLGSSVNFTTLFSQSNATYTCEPGLRFETGHEQLKATCEGNNTWSFLASDCTGIFFLT